MTMARSVLFAIGLMLCSPIVGSTQISPYAGFEQREIKTLALDEVSGYLAGEGMGFALAAELNSYPGPKHVMEIAHRLDLNEKQLKASQRIFDRMHSKAVEIGTQVVEKEQELDRIFAQETVTETNLKRVVKDIADLKGELRYVHLRAHLEMRSILSPEQIQTYNSLRGYGLGEHGRYHHTE
jgi:Spy/CpxP family protein refolding chaperone